jgi:hypothetical protein
MTKKHFIALADAIRVFREADARAFNKEQLEVIADFCQSQNPRFNRERWLAYIAGECGPNGGKVR